MSRCKDCVRKQTRAFRQEFGYGDTKPRRPTGRPPKRLTSLVDFDPATDEDVRDAVLCGGMEFTEIAIRLGTTRQAVQQSQERALAKLKRQCVLMGISLSDFITEARK